MLRLIEIFASVQGETSLAGLPTVFVRLAGCNLRCSWCDTPYSFGRGEKWELDAILKKVLSYGIKHVCVTGGEPLLQSEVHTLMRSLCDAGCVVSLETGGSLPTKNVDLRVITILDIKCPGSGMESKNHLENLDSLRPHDEVKFVLLDRKDYLFAKALSERFALFTRAIPPLFSPVHDKLDPKELVEWIIADKLAVRLNLQIHKYIWTPETIGV